MASTGEVWRLGRRPALDGLRGIAVLLVVAYHAIQSWSLAAGTVGVTVFFTLSGFLVTVLLLEEHDRTGRIRVSEFYQRRARRLLPALAMLLAIVTTLAVAIGSSVTDLRDLPAVVLYVGNWVPASGSALGALSHTWSLAVEEQFYLLAPLVIAVMLRHRETWLLAVAGVGIALSVMLRFVLWNAGAGADRVYYGTDTRMDALLVGVAVAVAVRRGWLPRVPGALPVALAGLAAVALTTDRYLLAPTVAPWLAALALAGIAQGDTFWLTGRFLVLVGRRSYGLYLWSYPCAVASLWLPGPFWADAIAMVAVAWGLALLSWRYVEQPSLRGRSAQLVPGARRLDLRAEVGGFDVQHRVVGEQHARRAHQAAQAQGHIPARDIPGLEGVAL